MSEIITVDTKITNLVKEKFTKHLNKIKDEVARTALKNKHVRGVKQVRFKSLNLPTKSILSFDSGDFDIDDGKSDLIVYEEIYKNNSDTTDTAHFLHKKTITDSWHWEVTAGVTFSYKTEVKIPEVASTTKGVEINLSATYGEEHGESTEFEWAADIQLQPRKVTVINAVLKQLSGKLPFTCTIRVDGTVNCEADLDIKTFKDRTEKFTIPLTRMLSESERTYTTTGVITGAAGIKSLVEKHLEPLSKEDRSSHEGEVIKEVIDKLTVDPKDFNLVLD